MPKARKAVNFGGGGRPRRGSLDASSQKVVRQASADFASPKPGSKGRKRNLSRTMTAIGMAAPEDQKSSMDYPEPAAKPSAESTGDEESKPTPGSPRAPKAIKKNRTDTIQANDQAPIKEGKAAKDKLPWVFDNVFDEESTVHDIHRDLTSEVIDSVMEGYHGTIFAYGQTGSGKTYTMVGDRAQEVPGVMSLGTKQMFELIKEDTYRDYMVRVSYMEVYMERVRDLLNPDAIGEELKVRQDTGGKGFFVECREVVVTNDEQIYSMLDAGNELRTVGATDMNAQSSRSHAIFRLVVESTVKKDVEQVGDAEDNAFRQSYLNLVDLAGSERTKDTGASGQRLKEAGTINLSLSCLSNIIRALSEKGKKKGKVHLPFRDSKLTQILQPSLGGNSRTAFICTVTLAAKFFEDTKSTLAFADRAKKVTNSPKKNIVMNQKAMLAEAQDEIEQLKQALKMSAGGQLPAGFGGGQSAEATKQQEEMEAKVKFLESMLVGSGAAQDLETMHKIWTPDMGKSAMDGTSVSQMLAEAEKKRVEEWRAEQRTEIRDVWEKIDADKSGTLDPEEMQEMFTAIGQPDIDVPAAMTEIDEDGDGVIDFEEFFEWWCTRSVADRERLKGKSHSVPQDRIRKLQILLRIAAGMAGSVKKNDARARTVGFAQMAQSMSLGTAHQSGGAAMSASAQRKFNELRIERDKLKAQASSQAAKLEEEEAASLMAQEQVQHQQHQIEEMRMMMETDIAELKATLQVANEKLSMRDQQLSKSHSEIAASKAQVEQLTLKLEQVETRAAGNQRRADAQIAELRAEVGDRERTVRTLSVKCQRMESEVSELQAAVVDLAVDERIIESEKARVEMEGKKRQTEEQVQQLRMEVASAKYMQTLYWEKRKSADTSSNVLERPAGEMLDPAVAAQQLAVQQARATGQAPPLPAAVAGRGLTEPGKDAADEMRQLLGLGSWDGHTSPAGNGAATAGVRSATSSPRTLATSLRVGGSVDAQTTSSRAAWPEGDPRTAR